LEVYSGNAGRFVTVSGDPWLGAPEEIMTVSDEVLGAIEAELRLSAHSEKVIVGEMPDLLPGVGVPHNLNFEARQFLEIGKYEDDRSATLNWTARCLFEVGLNRQEVLSVLAENAFAMEVALDHRREDEERALIYLWKHHVLNAEAKATPVATSDDFAEVVEADPKKKWLHGELRRLASLDEAVFLASVKEEAQRLSMAVTDLKRLVKKERNRGKQVRRGPVDYHSPLPLPGEDGFPRNHLENLREIMRRLEVTVRYNVIKKREEILIPGRSYSTDNTDNSTFAWLESECSLFDFPTTKLTGFITEVADSNIYNPVATWVSSTPWDGVPRLGALFATLKCEPQHEAMKKTLLKRWLLSAIAVAFSPNGCQTRGTLVLQGAQGLGKTRWLKRLAPDHLELVKEGHLLRPDNKDSVVTAISHWIVELGELDATFRRSDIAALNGFLTNMVDIVRRPYAKKDSHYGRRTVFCGSVNPDDFLHDPTGSSRFWVVPVIDVEYTHNVDMQQVWAEVLTLWKSGEQHWLTKEESKLLEQSNQNFESTGPLAERLLLSLNWEAHAEEWEEVPVTALLNRMGIDNPTRGQSIEAGKALRGMEGVTTRRDKRARFVKVPPRATVAYAETFQNEFRATAEDFRDEIAGVT
jgi:putative DNA primase/helicase